MHYGETRQTVSRALTQEIKRVTEERQRKAAADLLRFVRSYSYVRGLLMVARARLIRGRRRRRQRRSVEDRRRRSTRRVWHFRADYTVRDDISTKLTKPRIGVHHGPRQVARELREIELIEPRLFCLRINYNEMKIADTRTTLQVQNSIPEC